jgi:hypothetical protein
MGNAESMSGPWIPLCLITNQLHPPRLHLRPTLLLAPDVLNANQHQIRA